MLCFNRVGSDNEVRETVLNGNGTMTTLNGKTENGNGHVGENERGVNFCKA